MHFLHYLDVTIKCDLMNAMNIQVPECNVIIIMGSAGWGAHPAGGLTVHGTESSLYGEILDSSLLESTAASTMSNIADSE